MSTMGDNKFIRKTSWRDIKSEVAAAKAIPSSISTTTKASTNGNPGALYSGAITSTGSNRSFDEEEKVAFSGHINNLLSGDPVLSRHMPLDVNTNDLYEKSSDGLIFCKLINLAVRDAIDERAMNIKDNMNLYEKTENLNLALNAAKGIGCQVVNIGAKDLLEGRPTLVLGLVWQIIKIQLLSQISLSNFPELVVLLEEGETMAALMRMHPEVILLRWLNYHLRRGGSERKVNNFGQDLADSEVFCILLHQLDKDNCPIVRGVTEAIQRAELVIRYAKMIGTNAFLQPKDICDGNKKLLVSFCAQIFNTLHGLRIGDNMKVAITPLPDSKELIDIGESREERSFRLWMNSLKIDGLSVDNIFADIESGVAVLLILDKIVPGIVNPKRVNKEPRSRFKKLENANYIIELCKQLKFSIVGISGTDITDGNQKLILAILWQIMRKYTLVVLEGLAAQQGMSNITEAHIISWANAKVASSGRPSIMKSFRDSSLKNSLFLLDLVAAIEPRTVHWDLVAAGETVEEQLANARYVISNARKLGATVFLTPEDILEVNTKMIMIFVAALWSTVLQQYT